MKDSQPYVTCKEYIGFRNLCSRKAVKEGYCTQHHPDSVADRREKMRIQQEWRLDRLQLVNKVRDASRYTQAASKTLSDAVSACRDKLHEGLSESEADKLCVAISAYADALRQEQKWADKLTHHYEVEP